MTTIHVMLDLETWGTRPGCDIRSIGAVVFDPVAGKVAIPDGDNAELSFYIATDNPVINELAWTPPQGGSAIEPWRYAYKLTRDPSTVKWWSEQNTEAQAAFVNPVKLYDACIQFAVWLESLSAENPTPRYPDEICTDLRIWANDPHFDVSILDAVYDAVGLPVPWHYRVPRSLRTVAELAGMTRDDFTAFNHGTAHNALDDAIAQAAIVCEAYKRLGLANSEPRNIPKTEYVAGDPTTFDQLSILADDFAKTDNPELTPLQKRMQSGSF